VPDRRQDQLDDDQADGFEDVEANERGMTRLAAKAAAPRPGLPGWCVPIFVLRLVRQAQGEGV
jgi:hypothetical protein